MHKEYECTKGYVLRVSLSKEAGKNTTYIIAHIFGMSQQPQRTIALNNI